jgi:predicted ATPase
VETQQGEPFGDMLRRLRLAARLTQEELAERAGLSTRGLIYLEQNARRPYRDTVRRLTATLALADADRVAFEAAAGMGRPAAVPATLGSLPHAPSQLIGRGEELAAVARLLQEPHARLLTVVGPPGVGKTHLALQVAHDLRAPARGEVVFVALAPVREPALVLPTIAAALGLRESPGQTLRQQLLTALATRPVLLVLDNCEQVIQAAAEIAALVAGCPALRVLATSRAPWRVRAERVVLLAPLALPDLAYLPAPDVLVGIAAVALFVARAQAVKADFALSAANAAAVAEVCVRLDGLPLAIELAAARSKLFAPGALAARLERRLPLLVGGPRDLPERQRTLRAALAWSHDLLTVAAQVLFRRLAVFVGGATMEGLLAVCAGETPAEEADLLAWLEGLVDHNLLQVAVQVDEEPRYGMLETVREYGLERLAESGEEGQVRARQARYFLAVAEQASAHLFGPDQASWLASLERDHDNLRAVLRWMREQHDAAAELRMVAALSWFWIMRGHFAEARECLQAALRNDPEADTLPARVRALDAFGQFMREVGEYAEAAAFHREELALARKLDDRRSVANALNNLGYLAHRLNNYAQAADLLQESVAEARTAGDGWLLATALSFLAQTCCYQGRYMHRHKPRLRRVSSCGAPRESSAALPCHSGVLHALPHTKGHSTLRLAISRRVLPDCANSATCLALATCSVTTAIC